METTNQNNTALVDDKPQDIKADLRKFNRSEQMITKAINALSAITVISNQEQCDAAMATLKEPNTVSKAIEEKRQELVKPFNDAVKKINNYAKTLVVTLPTAIDNVKKLVVGFQQEQERLAAAERKKVRTAQLISLGMEFQPVGYRYKAVVVNEFMIINLDDKQWLQLMEQVTADINQLKQKELLQKQEELEEVSFFGTEEEKAEIEANIEALQQAPTLAAYDVATAPSSTKVKGITKRWTFEITDESLVPREYLMVDEKKIREVVTAGSRSIPGIRIFQQESLTIR